MTDDSTVSAEQFQTHKGEIASALATLRQQQVLYTEWEPLLAYQCQATMKSILAMQNALRQWESFFRGSAVGLVYNKQTAHLVVQLQTLGYLHDRVDEAAIAVRAYQPKCHSETVEAFRMLKSARDRLKSLIDGIQEEILDPMDELFPESVTVVEAPPLLLSESKQ